MAGAETEGRRFDHHALDVYEAAIQFIRWRERALRRVPRRSDLSDQLTRASTSIALNIAEGAGERSGAEQQRFFRFARRSATECDAALDVVEAMALASPPQLAAGRALISRIIAMLTGLTRPSRPAPSRRPPTPRAT